MTYTPQIVGIIYPIQIYISKNVYYPNPVSTRHTETLQLTFIPQVLACYIQYQHTDSTDIYSPKCWKGHSNPMYKGIMTSQRSSIFTKIWQNFMTFDISWYLLTSDISLHLPFHDFWHFMTFDISWYLTFHDIWHFMTFDITI